MSTAIAIGASTLQLPDPGESYSLPLINQNNTNIANEVNKVKGLKHSEYTGPSVISSAGIGVNFGQFVLDSTATFNNTFVTPNSADGKLKIIETGTYLIHYTVLPATNPGLSHLWVTRTGSVADNIISVNFQAYGNNSGTATALIYAVANDILQAGVTTTNTVNNVGSRIKVTKVQG